MFPGVAFLSTSEIAERAGVSQPTVTRLATALGFAGFPQFRTAMRDAVLARPADPAVARRPDAAASAIERERANLEHLRRTAGGEQMAQAVRLLAATDPLGVVGLRASAAPADCFGYFARRVLPSVRVHTDAASVDDAVLQLCQQGATAVLIFVMPRHPAGTVAALRLARRLGMATVVVADTALPPFLADVDVLLVAPVGTGLIVDSHAAAVVLAAGLLDAVAEDNPQRTRARLDAHETLVQRWAY